MKSFVGGLIALMLSVSVGAEPLLEGRVRLSSGQPAVGVQVRLFDLTDLRRFVGTTTDETGHFSLSLQTFSMDRGTALPTGFVLGQNYPNPFNPSTIIPYQLSVAGHVRLEVFNLLGQHLATLVDEVRSAGTYTAQWDGTDVAGRAVGAGVYIYRLSSDRVSESRRMVLVDGQAGVSAVGAATQGLVRSVVEESVEADGSVYGLVVSGQGLVPYVDPTFRVGADEVAIVVAPYDGIPRMKIAISGVLGDVNGDGRVDIVDALIVAIYSVDSSVPAAHIPNIFLGDVDADGDIDFTDAYLIGTYIVNPSDPMLPPRIGDDIVDDHGDIFSEATQVSLGDSIAGSLSTGDTDYFRVAMSSSGVLVAYTTGSTDTYGSILDGSGSVLAIDDEGGEGANFLVVASVSSDTYYIEVRGYESSAIGDYTLHVDGGFSDLVIESPSASDSTLAFRQPFTLQVTVRNQGAFPSDATTLSYYRSTDATVSPSDVQVGSDDVRLLFESDASTESISLIAPEDAGTYYYGACVQSVVGESNTDNNCSDAVRVTVSQMPQIYWTDWRTGKIQRATGGSYIEDLVTGLNSPTSIALDIAGGHMYWTDQRTDRRAGPGKIQRATLDGSDVEDLVPGLDYPASIALDIAGGHMYWTDWGTGKIQRAALDGSNIEDLVLVAGPGIRGTALNIALDMAGGYIYWINMSRGGIQRATLDGSNIEDLVTELHIPGFENALDIAGGHMYWTGSDWTGPGKIQRAALDGSNIEDLVTGLDYYPDGIALDMTGGHMYWTGPGKIQRATLNGSNIEELIIGLDSPDGIALNLYRE